MGTSVLFAIKPFLQRFLPYISSVTNILAMTLWILLQNNTTWGYALLIGVIGYFMGGLFNSMHSNDLFEYTKNDVAKTEMFAVLILITNYVITSGASLLASVVIHYGRCNGKGC